LPWGPRAADGALRDTGALGPVDGFGLDELTAGCAEAGSPEPRTDKPLQAKGPPAEPTSFS
jgi:hypothetical protein